MVKFRKILGVLALVSAATSAHAVYTLNFVQSGPDMVLTGSGSLDISGTVQNAGIANCVGGNGYVTPNTICIGGGAAGITIPAAFAVLPAITSGANSFANSSTGPAVYVSVSSLYLPAGYVSGTAISNSSTFNGQTYASMGLTVGTTISRALPSGDTIVIRVGPIAPSQAQSIPTLGEYALFALATVMALTGFTLIQRRRSGS
ncbi:hypothetical protein [Acidovorax delafieldii]|uniref:hypothetical protein n=1 Tax=Acidovorax delafieldii TaxID=47920 RepID=UPI0026A4F22B